MLVIVYAADFADQFNCGTVCLQVLKIMGQFEVAGARGSELEAISGRQSREPKS
jgi:hypothetical protein